jgi:hypothetical protein
MRRRQQEYLEKSVEGLKRKLQTSTDVHRADTVRFRQARALQPCDRRCQSVGSVQGTPRSGPAVHRSCHPAEKHASLVLRAWTCAPAAAGLFRRRLQAEQPSRAHGPAGRWRTAGALPFPPVHRTAL